MARLQLPQVARPSGSPVYIPSGAFSSHVLGWPGGSVAEPDPFLTGVAADNRKFPKWQYHEPNQGEFHWDDDFYSATYGYYANAEFAVNKWHTEGRKIMLTFDATWRPAWASLENDAAWSAWVTAAITRWRPEYVEFTNEPSSHAIDVNWLVRMYSLGKAAAKAVDPNVIVVGPSCESISNPGNGVEYTASFLDAGGGAHIDVLGVHLYPYGLPNHEPASLIAQMAWLRAGISGKWTGSIFNTESGCSPEIFPSQSKETQLRWFWQQNMLPVLLGCQKSWWYGWGEDNFGPYLSPYLADIRAMLAVIVSFEGTTAVWKMLPDGRLRVVRHDGREFVY